MLQEAGSTGADVNIKFACLLTTLKTNGPQTRAKWSNFFLVEYKTFVYLAAYLKRLPQLDLGLVYIEKYFFSKKIMSEMGDKRRLAK